MDDIVKAAMAKWPNVPDCYGWLGLDGRGQWWMRDAQAQAMGPFGGAGSSLESKGALLRHDKLIEFIQRNYAVDEAGRWFFQNGPQRVFVELEAAPWVLRVDEKAALTTMSGRAVSHQCSVLDESGRLYVGTDLGLGLVHTQDMLWAASAVERGLWTPESARADELPARFGFVLSPAAQAVGRLN